jgi:hypothetical protein
MTCDQIDTALFSPYLPCTGKQLILDQFGQAGLGGRVRQPNTNFGPQLGFAWDPRKNGKTVIRGGTGLYFENGIFNNVMFDRPGRLQKGLFWGTASPCPDGVFTLPGGKNIDTIDGVSIAKGVCGQRVGNVMTLVADMQQLFQQATAAAGSQVNGNFLGETLANGGNSTANGFIGPGFRTPRSIQMNLGIQHEIRPGMVLSADFLRNVGLRYLLSYDTNHVGDSRFLNRKAALNAINTTLLDCGLPSVNAVIAANAAGTGCPGGPDPDTALTGLIGIGDFADRGLDSGKVYLSGYPASLYGMSPDAGAAFPGINPLVGENEMLFPIGRSTYTALQMKLVQTAANPFRGLKNVNLQVAYSLSRFNSMAYDQDFIPWAWDYRNPGRYYGPNSMDRTHQFSFGGTFDFPHGPRFSFVSHFFSPLPQDMYIENQGRSGENFFSDPVGDGQGIYHVLPGTQLGAFGRSVTPSNINKVITDYNNTIGGTILPQGQALVDAGILTSSQMTALGAVADTLPLAPKDQMNMSWVHGFDAKFTWPIKIKERMTLEPSVGFYNLFNFSNFNSISNYLSGFLNGSAGTINGTALSDLAAKDSLRVGAGTGVNTTGAPRQIEWGLRFTF